MEKQSLFNSLKNASFKVNKRYHDEKPSLEKETDVKNLLIEVHKTQDAGNHDHALELISKARFEKSENVDNHAFLLIAESISCIALDQTDRALESLSKAEVCIPNSFFGREDRDYLISRNLSSVHVNMSTCYITKNDYVSSIKHALIARDKYSQWHGPHVTLFSSLLRMIKSDQRDKTFTMPDKPSDGTVREANHEFLIESIKTMARDWPAWNSDTALLSHLVGDESTVADTDLVGMIEIIEDLDYSLNANK